MPPLVSLNCLESTSEALLKAQDTSNFNIKLHFAIHFLQLEHLIKKLSFSTLIYNKRFV